MHNWDYPKTTEKDEFWRLQRQLLYGLDKGEKIDRGLVKKYWGKLRLDKHTKTFLELLLWHKKF